MATRHGRDGSEERALDDLGVVLGEAAAIAKLVGFWALVLVLPWAATAIFDPVSLLGFAFDTLVAFVLVVGGANVALYVIARAIALGTGVNGNADRPM